MKLYAADRVVMIGYADSYVQALWQQHLAKNPGGYCPIHATGATYAG